MTDTLELPDLWVAAEEARRSPVRSKLSLNDEERAVLAQENGLASVDSFAVKATALGMKGKLRVEGEIIATLTYTCGVSLKTYPASLNLPFEQFYIPPTSRPKREETLDIDPLDENDVEPLLDGQANLADLAYQLFTLALDPYPRHPDVASPSEDIDALDDEAEAKEASPFAILKDLKL